MKFMPWYLRWLGFSMDFKVKALESPKEISPGKWSYQLQLISYNYYWLGIKFKTTSMEFKVKSR